MKPKNKKLHVSSLLGIQNPRHSLFDFVDVNISGDQKLFIDPCLVSLCKDSWCKESSRIINDFFDEFYGAYKLDDYKKKYYLLSHSGEVNYTKLGYGNGRNGHGNTAEGLIRDFKPLEEFIKKIPTIGSVIDVPLLVLGFNEDGLSDMLTNIIHNQLNKYTLAQLDKYNIKPNANDTFYAWDADKSSWNLISEPCYKYTNMKNEEEKLLLTPKRIVRKKYLFKADHFLKRVILEREKKATATKNSKGKSIYGVTKKELEERIEKNGENWKYDYVVDKIIKKPMLLQEYHDALDGFYINRGLSDEDLDTLIYGKNGN